MDSLKQSVQLAAAEPEMASLLSSHSSSLSKLLPTCSCAPNIWKHSEVENHFRKTLNHHESGLDRSLNIPTQGSAWERECVSLQIWIKNLDINISEPLCCGLTLWIISTPRTQILVSSRFHEERQTTRTAAPADRHRWSTYFPADTLTCRSVTGSQRDKYQGSETEFRVSCWTQRFPFADWIHRSSECWWWKLLLLNLTNKEQSRVAHSWKVKVILDRG